MPEFKPITNPDDIRLNTHDEVDQILARPPGWLLQWGISIVFLAVLIFGVLAWLIKYPDEIAARVYILSESPPIRVMARANGKLANLFIENDDRVSKDELIGVIESPANFEDVLLLSEELENLSQRPTGQWVVFQPESLLQLGVIQPSYAAFAEKLTHFQYQMQRQSAFQKIQSLNRQIANIRHLNDNLTQQKQTHTKTLEILQHNVNRNKKLFEEGTGSQVDFEKSELQLLQQQQLLEDLDNRMVQNKITTEQLHRQIIDLEQTKSDDLAILEGELRQSLQHLETEIALWSEKYLIKAPISGNVSFSGTWSEQQFVQANQEILTVVPTKKAAETTPKTIGRAYLPVTNSGKVRTDQRVNIRLDGFPYQEFGILKGKVKNISLVPVSQNLQEASYLLEIALPDSLITTYNKLIPFRQEMQGTALIITEDRRVIDRVFDRVLSLARNR